MPSIAQQDYIYIEVADMASLTTSEKKALTEKIANKTIFDTIIKSGKYSAKVIAYALGDTDTAGVVVAYDIANGQIQEMDIDLA